MSRKEPACAEKSQVIDERIRVAYERLRGDLIRNDLRRDLERLPLTDLVALAKQLEAFPMSTDWLQVSLCVAQAINRNEFGDQNRTADAARFARSEALTETQ